MPIHLDATNDTPLIHTERLELSFGTAADANVLFPYVHGESGREVTDNLVWDGPEEISDLVTFFELHATGTFGKNSFHWLLRDRSGRITGNEGEAIGSIGLGPTKDPGICDIGYWLAQPFWGRGLMAEAIEAIVDLALDHHGFATVAADVFSTNERSAALLRKVGFEHNGSIPDYNIKRGYLVDAHHYVRRAERTDIN